MKKLLLALGLALALVACDPPIEPEDPSPVVPDPVEVVEAFEGVWSGRIQFESVDGFGNVEVQHVGITFDVEMTTETVVVGSALFATGLSEECSLSGTQIEEFVEFILLCEGLVGMSFSGEISDSVFAGLYETTIPEIILLRDGTFEVVYVGE